METKILKAVFGGGTSTVTNKRTRTDYGQVLEIIGIDLPDTFECIFSNSATSAGVGKKQIGSAQRVLIPDEYLTTGQTIYAWILLHDTEDDGRHMYSIRIPVADMPDTSPEEPTPVEQSVISQAITALNSAVEKTAQDVIDADASAQASAESAQDSARSASSASDSERSAQESAESASTSAKASAQSAQTASAKADSITGLTAQATTLPSGSSASASYNAESGVLTFGIPKGDKGDKGEKGDTGAQGIQGERGLQGETGQAGRDGTDGTDGVSPTVSITPITGGHRITITDKDGEHSADVMDGTGNVNDVQINGTSIVTDGVANVPVATNSVLGAVRTSAFNGTTMMNEILTISTANSSHIKGGTKIHNPITPSRQHESTFYGLAKAAGADEKDSTLPVGEYTEEAKSAISEMLGGSVSVSGTTPAIVAKSGIRYVCGEVATLDFTPSASGICDVVFTSGSTPTMVILPSTVKFPDGELTIEANTTYEINILDGIYGAVMAWT